jgi:hypothetical protein
LAAGGEKLDSARRFSLAEFLFPTLVIAVAGSILVFMITLIVGTNRPGSNSRKAAAHLEEFTSNCRGV